MAHDQKKCLDADQYVPFFIPFVFESNLETSFFNDFALGPIYSNAAFVIGGLTF